MFGLYEWGKKQLAKDWRIVLEGENGPVLEAHLPGGPFSTSMIVGARAYRSTLYHLHVHGDNKPLEGSPSTKPMFYNMLLANQRGHRIPRYLFVPFLESYPGNGRLFFSCLLRRRFSRCFRFSLVNFVKYLAICCWFQWEKMSLFFFLRDLHSTLPVVTLFRQDPPYTAKKISP